MKHSSALLVLLSDGRFHSGQQLGDALGLSRANVWHMLQGLVRYGLQVEAVKGRGYRLTRPLELLNKNTITAQLSAPAFAAIPALELFLSLESTNAYLMMRGAGGAESGLVCLAEHQSGGKGRRGREWVSPLGRNIYLSLLWRFSDGPMRLAGLSIAVAVAVVQALETLDCRGLQIKWPNDIVSPQGKVGGILLEVAGESSGPCYCVVGIGLNVDMPAEVMGSVEQPWSNLPYRDQPHSRNTIAAQLINHVTAALSRFPASGISPYLSAWRSHDVTLDKEVSIHLHDRSLSGTARGIDETGALLVDIGGQRKAFASGEVTLRLSRP